MNLNCTSASEMEKTRRVSSTALPYTQTEWPAVSSECAATLMGLLVPLLKPIGDHNRDHAQASKGRGRGKKSSLRKNQKEKETAVTDSPQISSSVSVGFNSTVRKLESFARRPGTQRPHTGKKDAVSTIEAGSGRSAVVFVCKSALPDPVSQSIPLLVAAASLHSQDADAIRLVEISASAEATLSAALGLPRIAVLGLDDNAPGAEPLIKYLRGQIEPVKAPWPREGPIPSYLPLKVNTEDVVIGENKASRKRKTQA